MDLSSFRRSGARAIEESWAATPDYPMLVATLAAMQAATCAARAASDPQSRPRRAPSSDPLVDILTAASGWRDSVELQGGCFHRGSGGGEADGA